MAIGSERKLLLLHFTLLAEQFAQVVELLAIKYAYSLRVSGIVNQIIQVVVGTVKGF